MNKYTLFDVVTKPYSSQLKLSVLNPSAHLKDARRQQKLYSDDSIT